MDYPSFRFQEERNLVSFSSLGGYIVVKCWKYCVVTATDDIKKYGKDIF